MPIPFRCACGRTLRARDELAGRRVKCPTCGETVGVPTAESAAAEGDAAQPPAKDPWAGEASPHDEGVQPEPTNVEELDEVLPADDDEDEDEDELSTREKVRRKEERAADREAERRAKDRKKRRSEKRIRDLEEEGRRRNTGSGPRRSRGPILYNVNAGIGGGIAMIVLSIICSGLALKATGVLFVTPVLFLVGVAAVIKGIIDSTRQ
jgi:hypothetical protein